MIRGMKRKQERKRGMSATNGDAKAVTGKLRREPRIMRLLMKARMGEKTLEKEIIS